MVGSGVGVGAGVKVGVGSSVGVRFSPVPATILCIILFSKQSKLQKDIEVLEQELRKYDQGGGTGNNKGGSGTLSPAPTPTPTVTPSPEEGGIPATGTSHKEKTGGMPKIPTKGFYHKPPEKDTGKCKI